MKSINASDRIKLEATRLQKQAREAFAQSQTQGERSDALSTLVARFRALREWQNLDDGSVANRLAVVAMSKCLDLLAIEAGHDGWAQYVAVLQGSQQDEEATELYHFGKSEFNLNVWCPSYEAARIYLETHRGFFLLQYKGSFFLAQEGHIRGLGLDPVDPDWEKIGWDWVSPKDIEAKDRLRQKLRQHREKSLAATSQQSAPMPA